MTDVPGDELDLVLGTRDVGVEWLRQRVARVRADGDAAILKVAGVGLGPHRRWPARPDPADPFWWRREAEAYASGLLEPFGVPRVRAVVERGDGTLALWLDDAGDQPSWTPPLLAAAATRIGRAQAALLEPTAPWLGRGFLAEYLRLHDVEPDPAIVRALDAVPQTICHNDLHPDNVLASGLVIDWAYCGVGALGLDAGVLVADGLADGAYAPDLADAVAEAVWDAYAAELDGVDLDPVRFAFTRGTALRLSWLPRGRSASWDATIRFLQRLASAG